MLAGIDLDLVAAEPEAPELMEELAAEVSAEEMSVPQAEIYDSGCSKHLTPYREDLKNFVEIPPKSFRAANKQSMHATGMGELVIDMPNGTNASKLRLTEVLYSPEVGYTLVSVGRLDEKGFSLTFSGGKCTIRGPDGEHIGTIPQQNGLYCVAHQEPDTAGAVEEMLTLDQFHCRMGHISPHTACRLVKNGL